MSKVLYFTAPWCGPCKALGPIIEGLSGEIPFEKINIDNDMDRAAQYSVRSVPTLIKIDSNGNAAGRLVGLARPDEIKTWYNG
jgi:thioredoxin 1